MEWLNYNHLHYFWIVAREANITRAAEHLRLAPSTVSIQIGRLEESLGGRLFKRVGRGVELTDLGRIVFQYAEKIFSLGFELLDTVHGRGDAERLRFEVGIVDSLPKIMARKILEPALKLSGKVHLLCHEGKKNQLLGELAIHNLDIVLTDTPVKPGLSVKAYNHLLGECGVTFCAVKSLAHPLRHNFPQSLDHAPMLLPTSMSALRGNLDQWFHNLDIYPEIVGEFDDHALLKVFGQAGDGVFVVPSIIEQEVCRQHKVEIIARVEKVRERIYAISVERIIKHPAVAAIWSATREFGEQWSLTPGVQGIGGE